MEQSFRDPFFGPPLYIYPPAEFSVAYILCIWFAVDIFYRKPIFDRQPCAGRIAAPTALQEGLHAPGAQEKAARRRLFQKLTGPPQAAMTVRLISIVSTSAMFEPITPKPISDPGMT